MLQGPQYSALAYVTAITLALALSASDVAARSDATTLDLPTTTPGIMPNAGQWPAYVRWSWRSNGLLVTASTAGISLHTQSEGSRVWTHALSIRTREAVGESVANTLLAGHGRTQFIHGRSRSIVAQSFSSVRCSLLTEDAVLLADRKPRGLDVSLTASSPLEWHAADSTPAIASDVRRWARTWRGQLVEVRVSGPSAKVVISASPSAVPGPTAASLPVDGLAWSTYLGGADDQDIIRDILLRPTGRVVIAGTTESLDYPADPASLDADFEGCCEGFVAELEADGSTVVFNTFLGGAQGDFLQAARLRDDGCIALTGYTASTDFPVTPGAFQTDLPACCPTILFGFATLLNPEGTEIVASTFLGGTAATPTGGIGTSAHTMPQDAVLSPDGEFLITGTTHADDFPTTANVVQPVFPPGQPGFRAFLTRFTADLEDVVFSSFLGGDDGSVVRGLTLCSEREEVTVFGIGASRLIRVSADGTEVIYDTSFTATGSLRTLSAFDVGNGEIIIAGDTTAADLPVPSNAFQVAPLLIPPLLPDAFVMRLAADGRTPLWGSYLGGLLDETNPIGLHVGPADTITLVGSAGSTTTFPITPGVVQPTKGGGNQNADYFITRFHPDGHSLSYSTFFGGPSADPVAASAQWRMPLAVSPDGSVITGASAGPAFPTTPGAAYEDYGGAIDGAIFRLTMLPTGVGRRGTPSPDDDSGAFLAAHHAPFLGSNDFALLVSGAPVAATGLLGVSTTRLEAPVTVAGIELWLDPAALTLHTWTTDVRGFAQRRFPLPDDPMLLGLSFTAQSLWPNARAWSASDALDIEISEG